MAIQDLDVKKDNNHQELEAVEEELPTAEEQRWTPEEEKNLIRKIDLFLLPTIWLMYLLSYVDRTNIGNAKIAGMQEDLNLDSGEYSLALIVFFIGYVIFEIPSNMILSKSKPSLFLPIIMIIWGALTCCMAAVKTYSALVGLRAVIGCIEAGFSPGILLIISSWYKRVEQSKRFAVYISAAILSGAFGGLLAGAITSNLEGAHGIRGWRWLFIVEGAATIGWAICAGFILLDFPATSTRLSERERFIAVNRLLVLQQDPAAAAEEDQIQQPTHVQAFKQSVINWRTWLFTFGYMVIVGSSTLSYFYPTLVQGLGYTSHMAQYMTVPIYAVAFICTAITGYFMDKIPHHRGLIISTWLFFAMLCAITVCTVYNFTARYVLLVLMAAGLWSTNALSLSYASSTFSPMRRETRGVSLAFVNAMGNLAQIYGAYLVSFFFCPFV
ncbi:MAG: hypothetical protein M1834_008427 [Cirrosporium novae-zelandiae]|nr:MAG: hypothetical protein M1834_008427 [Cirrosporium novae-zelandiae]